MSKFEKLFLLILKGNSDNNIDFKDLQKILEFLEFDLRIKGSNNIYSKSGIEEIINIQAIGSKAKPYQVK